MLNFLTITFGVSLGGGGVTDRLRLIGLLFMAMSGLWAEV